MTRWAVFDALCQLLRAGIFGSEPPPRAAVSAWEPVIEASSYHLVTPALAWCLRDQPDLPDDVREYLDAALTLNARRNALLLDELERLVRALNRIEIEPVLLKGSAHLIEDLYPTPGLRVLGDLDLLVPAKRVQDAAVAAEAIGFTAGAASAWVDVPGHHLPRLYDRDSEAGVELHTEVGAVTSQAVLPASWLLPRTQAVAFRTVRVRTPDPTAKIVHNVVHHQLSHGHHRNASVELRQLLDLALLRVRHGSTIDWAEVDRRFANANAGEALDAYLRFDEVLLGQEPPPIRIRARANAIDRLRAAIERPGRQRWARLAGIPANYVAGVRQRPAGIVNLLSARMWPARIRMIVSAWRGRKW